MYKEFVIGSRLFFSGIEDFETNFGDAAIFFDSKEDKENERIDMMPHMNYYVYIKYDKSEFIEKLYNKIKQDNSKAVGIGIILSKDICEYLGIGIEDIKKFKKLLNFLDNKHKYLQIIFNAYLDNKNMELSDEQLNQAYNMYKKYKSQS